MADLFLWPQASPLPCSISDHMLTPLVPRSLTTPSWLKRELVSPISPPLVSSQSSCFSFDASSLQIGSLGDARDSRAQWSSVDHEPSSKQSPLERLGFKLHLGDKKTRDGQQPKRRGPKPDSKPALTRRQELNRQAQRTHRERKELYIKALEQEVMRLKEVYEQNAKDREQVERENRVLKELLQAHGIHYDPGSASNAQLSAVASQYGGSTTSGSVRHHNHSVSTGIGSPTGTGISSNHNHSAMASPATGNLTQSSSGYQPVLQQGIDYDQVGVDFVLQYGRPVYPSPPPQ